MTAREIIESVGGICKGEQSAVRIVEGCLVAQALVHFEVPDMPGVTMSMYEHRIKTADDVRNHIAWKRKEFGK